MKDELLRLLEKFEDYCYKTDTRFNLIQFMIWLQDDNNLI